MIDYYDLDNKKNSINQEIDTIKDERIIVLSNENKRLMTEILKLKKELEDCRKQQIDAFAIGNAISDGICVVDKDGVITAINKGYTKITGLKESDVIGKSIKALIEQDYFDRAVSLRVIQEKRKKTAMARLTLANKNVLIIGTPFFDDTGNVTKVLTVMRDMTELLKLKEDLEQSQIENKIYQLKINSMKKKPSKLSGNSHIIINIRKQIESVASTDATVLIVGETGSGKEVVSGEIVRFSHRSDKPYIRVNCAAIPESLLESELFGYEKSSFTGAGNKEKKGLFEVADKGTILLDEIGEMPIALQAKLLRVLQEKELTRVGGTNPIKIDVRVLAATNIDLQNNIEKGTFRKDLYYRLNVVPISIPPLRERKEDIMIMVYLFLNKYNHKYNKQIEIDSNAMLVFENYKWPGNVREVMNIVERLVIMSVDDKITVENAEQVIGIKSAHKSFYEKNNGYKNAMESLEKELIQQALNKHKSTHKAAKMLGISQPSVVRKAKKLGITQW